MGWFKKLKKAVSNPVKAVVKTLSIPINQVGKQISEAGGKLNEVKSPIKKAVNQVGKQVTEAAGKINDIKKAVIIDPAKQIGKQLNEAGAKLEDVVRDVIAPTPAGPAPVEQPTATQAAEELGVPDDAKKKFKKSLTSKKKLMIPTQAAGVSTSGGVGVGTGSK